MNKNRNEMEPMDPLVKVIPRTIGSVIATARTKKAARAANK